MEKQVGYSAKKTPKQNYRSGIRKRHSKITVIKDLQKLTNLSPKHTKRHKTFKLAEKIGLRKKIKELS